MSDSGKAVFLSYASQDAEAAKRICEALRAAGVEVWFDQNELVGGDAWDQKIRGQIGTCALFVPLISANTQARLEGYFRREWKQAAARTQDMAEEKAFLLPVVIDGTRDAEAKVPAEFKSVQWTKLPDGETPPAFVARVQKLLVSESAALSSAIEAGKSTPHPKTPSPGSRVRESRSWLRPVIAGAATIAVVAAWLALKPGSPLVETSTRPSAPPATVTAQPAQGPSPGLTEARKLTLRARVLVDDDLMAGRENLRLAEELAQRAADLDPTDGEAWAALARVLGETWRRNYDSSLPLRERARGAVDRAARLAPDSLETGLVSSGYHAANGAEAEAERIARETLIRFPDDQRCLRWLAEICLATKKESEGLELLHRSAALPGGDVRALTMEASYLRSQRRWREAEALVDRSMALAPSYSGYLMKLLLLWDLDDLDRAQPYVEKIPARLQQEDVFAALIARYWLHREQPERALEVLNRVPREFFEEARQYLPKGWLTGWALQMSGRPVAAKSEWTQALAVVEKRLQAEPNRRNLVLYRSRLLALLGRRVEAEAAMQLAVELNATDKVGAAISAANVCVCAGDNEGAITKILAAMSDPKDLIRSGLWYSLKRDPMYAPIRSDPRIQALIAVGEEQLRQLKASSETKSDSATTLAGVAPDTKSIAVLAFANLSDDKANEYFSDGISEELLNVLAKVPGLKVTARTSAFFFKGKEVPIPEIAKQLGVAYVVEGSVRKQGDKVRITAQLIKAADGFHVWSDTFTRELKDVFAVQDEIADLIAQAMQLKLGMGSARKSAPVNPQAFELYVQARQAWSLRTIEGFARAEQMLQRALQLAPDFVRARAALIDVGQMRSFRAGKLGTFGLRGAPELEQSLVQVRGVLALEPDLAEAYSTLGQTLDAKWQREEAGRAYRRATELNPNYATGRQWYGMHLAELGYMDEALAELKAASELDPFSFIILDNYGWLLNLAGRNREAVQMLDRAAALNPGFDQTARAKATALAALGRTAEAQAIARPLKNTQRELDVWTLGLVGLHDEANTLLQRMDPGDVTTRYQALLAAGQREASLDALADLSGVSKGGVIDVLYQRIYDPLRDDPRFVRFVAAIGLTEAHARAQAWRAAHPPDIPEMKP